MGLSCFAARGLGGLFCGLGLLFLWALGLLFLVFWTDRSMVYSKSCPLAWCIPAWAGEPSPSVPDHPAASVYPRVGGGTGDSPSHPPAYPGLSPRGRGNRRSIDWYCLGLGSIPAWAGEPQGPGLHGLSSTVYPRVGGGTVPTDDEAQYYYGLSPRGRGNLMKLDQTAAIPGSIPAWAGEPWQTGQSIQRDWVYPRVGGGTATMKGTYIPTMGLSPRGRGNPYFANTNKVGISPKPIIGTSPSLLSDG